MNFGAYHERSSLMAPPKRASFNVCFCDIDGTLVHYPEAQAKWGNVLQRLSLHTGRPLFPRHEEFMLLAGEITGPSVIPGYFMYVERVRTRATEHCKNQSAGAMSKVNVFCRKLAKGTRSSSCRPPPRATRYTIFTLLPAVKHTTVVETKDQLA